MAKGTNEYVDEEDDRPYQSPERDPDRERDDLFYRQEEEIKKKIAEQIEKNKGRWKK
jgi:hypothetical protein